MTMKNRMIRMLIRWAWEKHPERVREALSDHKIYVARYPKKRAA